MDFSGRGEPLTPTGLAHAAELVGVSAETLWTVVTVETARCGFLKDRRPLVLFERHEFRRRTGGLFDASHPDISGKPGGYGPAGGHQHKRLAQAISCHRVAALESASWGLGQIMGYNAAASGHVDAETMVGRFVHGEDAQLLGMGQFIRTKGLDVNLKRHDWAGFARGYNGPNFAINRYDTKLAAAHASLLAKGLPDFKLRAVQLMLTYESLDPGSVDGRNGPRTRAAIAKFRRDGGLASGEVHDETLLTALCARLPWAAPPARRRDITPVQTLLGALEFDPGDIDGLNGPRTRAAMALAVLADGPTAALRARLPAVLSRSAVSRVAISAIQTLLRDLNFDPGEIDGLWGRRSEAASQALRRDQAMAAGPGLDATLVATLLRKSVT